MLTWGKTQSSQLTGRGRRTWATAALLLFAPPLRSRNQVYSMDSTGPVLLTREPDIKMRKYYVISTVNGPATFQAFELLLQNPWILNNWIFVAWFWNKIALTFHKEAHSSVKPGSGRVQLLGSFEYGDSRLPSCWHQLIPSDTRTCRRSIWHLQPPAFSSRMANVTFLDDSKTLPGSVERQHHMTRFIHVVLLWDTF